MRFFFEMNIVKGWLGASLALNEPVRPVRGGVVSFACRRRERRASACLCSRSWSLLQRGRLRRSCEGACNELLSTASPALGASPTWGGKAALADAASTAHEIAPWSRTLLTDLT